MGHGNIEKVTNLLNIQEEIDNFSQFFLKKMFRIDGLSKNIALEYDLSCVIRKDDISFSRKYNIFSLDRK